MSPNLHTARLAGPVRWTLRAAAAVALLGSALPRTALAQPGAIPVEADTAKRKKEAASDIEVKYAVPEVPAMSLLGGTTATITRPTTPKDFLAALADGVDDQGRAKQGFALEASLYTIFPGFQVSLTEYQKQPLKRIIASSLLSLATVQASGDTSSTLAAIGARTTLIDRGDPMTDSLFLDSLGTAILSCKPEPIPGHLIPRPGEPDTAAATRAVLIVERKQQALECMDTKTDTLNQRYLRRHWNATRVVLAFAHGERLVNSKVSDREHSTDRVWAVGSVRLSDRAGLLGYGDYSYTRRAGETAAYSAWTGGVRLNFGSPTFNGFAEWLGRSRSDEPPGPKPNNTASSLGIEFLAAPGLWISTGFGKRFEDTAKPDRVVLLANIRWGISTKSWLQPGAQ